MHDGSNFKRSSAEIVDLDKDDIPSTMASDGNEDADLNKSSNSSTFCLERRHFQCCEEIFCMMDRTSSVVLLNLLI